MGAYELYGAPAGLPLAAWEAEVLLDGLLDDQTVPYGRKEGDSGRVEEGDFPPDDGDGDADEYGNTQPPAWWSDLPLNMN